MVPVRKHVRRKYWPARKTPRRPLIGPSTMTPVTEHIKVSGAKAIHHVLPKPNVSLSRSTMTVPFSVNDMVNEASGTSFGPNEHHYTALYFGARMRSLRSVRMSREHYDWPILSR